MKKKCEQCQGKGGHTKLVGRFALYVSCFHCNGKGVWWPNKKPKTPKQK